MHRRKTHHTFWLSLTFLHVQYYFFPKKIFIFILELSTELGTYRVVRYKKKLPKFRPCCGSDGGKEVEPPTMRCEEEYM